MPAVPDTGTHQGLNSALKSIHPKRALFQGSRLTAPCPTTGGGPWLTSERMVVSWDGWYFSFSWAFFSPSFPVGLLLSGRLPPGCKCRAQGSNELKAGRGSCLGQTRAEGQPLRLGTLPPHPNRVSRTGKTVSHLPGIRHMALLPGILAPPKGAQSALLVLQGLLRGPLSCSWACLGQELYQWPLANGKDPSGPSLGSP